MSSILDTRNSFVKLNDDDDVVSTVIEVGQIKKITLYDASSIICHPALDIMIDYHPALQAL